MKKDKKGLSEYSKFLIKKEFDKIHPENIFSTRHLKDISTNIDDSLKELTLEDIFKDWKTNLHLADEYFDALTFAKVKPVPLNPVPMPKRTIDSFKINNNTIEGAVEIIQDPDAFPDKNTLFLYVYFKINGKQYESMQRISYHLLDIRRIKDMFKKSFKDQVLNILEKELDDDIEKEKEIIKKIDFRNMI